MPAARNFNEFYDSQLGELLLPFEEERKKLVTFGYIGYGLLIMAGILFLLGQINRSAWFFVGIFILIIPAIVVLVIFYNKRKNYVSGFKENIVHSIIKFIDPGLRYSPYAHVNENDYKRSGLYLAKPDRFNGDDYVEGTRGKTFFCFSELHTEYEESSGKNTTWHTIFKGLFFIADFNKHFHGRTYVYSETNPQLNFFTKMLSSFASKLEKIKLESSDFEDQFIVYSSDQVEARYILTPSFMERLIKLQQMMGAETSYSFVESNIYVAVPISDKLFEPSVFSPNNYEKLGDYYNTVHIVFDIIDELNLNLRIWTKD
jgi:hypothetical protein